MRVRLLGTAAGGGFPQWNCNCYGCKTAREQPFKAIPRTQSCVTVSADGEHWFLLNVPPDIRVQIESFPPLRPPKEKIRGTAIQAALITNADLDHSLGLFQLREGEPLSVYGPPAVTTALMEGLGLQKVLQHYSGVEFHDVPLKSTPLPLKNKQPSGLLFYAFPVPGKLPRYMGGFEKPGPHPSAVGYRIVDEKTGGKLVFIPDVASSNDAILREMNDCDALLLDGTFWTEREMIDQGTGTLTASQMAHWVVGNKGGSFATIKGLPARHKIYVHINNTNPMLIENSKEKAEVDGAGVEVGRDGMEFSL